MLKRQNISTPTPVQAAAIPLGLEGRDVMAIAQTGTGKTLAFGLPALTRLAEQGQGKNRMLVLTPTRELAQQVELVLQPHARALQLHTVCIYGGAGIDRQAQQLRRGCDIIVATPGRLLDHMERGNVRLNNLSVLVLDEADRMLDMGFMPDIKRITKDVPKDRQTLMFSATLPREIEVLARELQNNPEKIVIGPISSPVDKVRQGVYTVHGDGKLDLLSAILRKPEVTSTLVFIRTKHRTDRVAKALHRDGFKAEAIHGGRSQRQRDKAIDSFRRGHTNVLVATDVAARGLDVQGITHVVNFDIPATSEDYIHRIGRTARASATGDAITFVSPEDARELGLIERALGRVIPREDWDGAVHVRSHFQNEAPRSGGRSPYGGGGARRQGNSRPFNNNNRNNDKRDFKSGPVKSAARTGDASEQRDTIPSSRRESFHRDHFEKGEQSENPGSRTGRPIAPERSDNPYVHRDASGSGHGRPRNSGQSPQRPGSRQRRAAQRSR